MGRSIQSKSKRKIVSSRHLASDEGWQLSEFEYGLIIAYNAFNRWMVHCATAAGYDELNPLDILVLHNINHREREKKLSDICFVLNIEDTHTVNYSIKKLLNLELIQGVKRGKEKVYSPTEKGAKHCEDYKDIRRQCLIEGYQVLQHNGDEEVSEIATFLRMISGLYDQASRAASSL